jgi:hypothetical protein
LDQLLKFISRLVDEIDEVRHSTLLSSQS